MPGYGFGLAFLASSGHRLVGHDGLVPGFHTYVLADPQTRTVALLLANTHTSFLDDTYIVPYLLTVIAGHPLPEIRPAAGVTPVAQKRLEGVYRWGNRVGCISLEGGTLYNRLEGFPKQELVPLSDSEFAFKGAISRLHFQITDGKPTGFVLTLGESPESFHGRMDPLPAQDPKVSERLLRDLKDLVAGTLTADAFTPELAKRILPDGLKDAAALFKSLGEPKGMELYERVERPDGICRYHYHLDYGEKHLSLWLGLNPDLQIGEVDYLLD